MLFFLKLGLLAGDICENVENQRPHLFLPVANVMPLVSVIWGVWGGGAGEEDC